MILKKWRRDKKNNNNNNTLFELDTNIGSYRSRDMHPQRGKRQLHGILGF